MIAIYLESVFKVLYTSCSTRKDYVIESLTIRVNITET